MLQFTDLNHTKHTINLNNLNSVTMRFENEQIRMTFHMIGPHAVPVIIDSITADRIHEVLGDTLIEGAVSYEQ